MIKLKIKMDFSAHAGTKSMECFMLPVWECTRVSFVKKETV